MGKKKSKGTQKVNPIMDASIASPPYETALGMSNTEEVIRDDQKKHVKLNSCKCVSKKNNNIPNRARTWESITNLYGDADTTEVWDDQGYKPKTFFSSNLHKQENPKAIIDKSESNDVVYPTSNLNNTPAKLSLIGLYRKHKRNKQNKTKVGQYFNKYQKDTDEKYSPYTEPELKVKLRKKPKQGLKDHYDTGVLSDLICTQGPCREALENLYNLHGLKYTPNRKENVTKSGKNDKRNKTNTPTKVNKIFKMSKNKQAKATETTNDGNVGYGDQISSTPLKKHDLKDLQCKCSFIGKMTGHTICKCRNNIGSTWQTLSNVNNDNSNKEKTNTKTLTKENKIVKKSKNKQAKATETTDDGNVGYGDQISSTPLKKHDLKNLQCKCSFIEKMTGHTICKCRNNIGSTLQTSSNVNNDNSNKEKTKTRTKENKIMKKSKKKQDKALKSTKDGNFGYSDQISPITLNKQDLKDVQGKRSFMGKMLRNTFSKYKNNNGSTVPTSSNVKKSTGDPLLEMKVNLTDMRVMNSSEVNKKIRKSGRTEKNMSCICPSHIENKRIHFDCKCRKKKKIVECKDSTCNLQIEDIKVKSKKKKRSMSPVYKKGKRPLFEVRLDSTNMDVINPSEFKHNVRKASQHKIPCPTGICKTMSKHKNVQLNCKCVGKKIQHFVNESGDRTFGYPEKKCMLSYLCSRVFSKSENWTGQEENIKRRRIRGNGYGTNIKRDDSIVRSHTHYKRNGVMINLPRGQTLKKGTYVGGRLSDVWCKCFCECGMKPKKPPKTHLKKPPIKKKIKKNVSRRRRRRGFFRKKKKDHRTLTDKILDCLEREQEDCEKKIKKKEKQYKENEKRAIKDNKKMMAAEDATYKTQQYRMDCLTNFISGFLNVSFESVRTVVRIPFSMIADPLSSIIYIKEKLKDPPAAIVRIFEWFVRTWRNQSSSIAKAIDESSTLNVIADQLEASTIYNALMAPRGKSTAEKNMYERRQRVRNRRIQKRQEAALYGCQHILLTTMRKTPCLWCYHICPELYPQCLNFISFMNNFLHIILYCGAVMCWTPCIVCFEICRAFMCCLLCTH